MASKPPGYTLSLAGSATGLFQLRVPLMPLSAGGMSGELQSLGLRGGQAFRDAEEVVARLASAGSALARALELPAVLEAREACEGVLAEVSRRLTEAAARLKAEEDRVDSGVLGGVLAEWVYLQRWQAQARGLLLRLEIP